MKLYEELKWRGLIDNITDPQIKDALNNEKLKFYIGVDPTGESLHIGHYCAVIVVTKILLDHGHKPIIIAGGGTGLIGDPKPNVERPMISKEEVSHNIASIKKQLSSILGADIDVVNNADWLCQMQAIDYLRDYGKYFNINYMLAKDTVKRRLDIGITYTEFSYMILQSIDFLKLYENYGVTMQIGGQDQWGNITAGLELIRKIHGADVKCYGFTIPLVTRADGTKFGKSESGEALWLDKERTSPYELYQYFINTEDSKAIDYLKRLTFLKKEEIIALETSLKCHPEKREAQAALAKAVITFLHGQKEYEKAFKMSQVLFNGEINTLTAEEIFEVFKSYQKTVISNDCDITSLLLMMKVVSSKREARELIQNGAISLNGRKITDLEYIISKKDFMYEKYLILRRGKKNYYIGIIGSDKK